MISEEDKIKKICTRMESHNLEFKVKFPKHADDIGKVICAFANNEGGRICFGISDDKEVVENLLQERELPN